MKKILSFLILMILVPQLAFASRAEDLKALADEYHYLMTVEWDQEDEAFAADATKSFEAGVSKLVKAGLTEKEIAIALGKSSEELSRMQLTGAQSIREFMTANRNDARGASWSGTVAVVSAVVVGGLMVYFIYSIVKSIHDKNQWYKGCVAANDGNEAPCIQR